MKEIVETLIKLNKYISTMESCTGGMIANEITNIPKASSILKYSCITYSNEYKIKMGVNKEIIDKYSVYSIETAQEMAKKIAEFSNSNYGIGITGKLKKVDPNNLYGNDDLVYISIYDKDNEKYYNEQIIVTSNERCKAKEEVVNKVILILKEILK